MLLLLFTDSPNKSTRWWLRWRSLLWSKIGERRDRRDKGGDSTGIRPEVLGCKGSRVGGTAKDVCCVVAGRVTPQNIDIQKTRQGHSYG